MDINFITGGCVATALVISVLAVRLWWHNGKAARKGKQGEKQVAKVLAKLKRKDFICFNDVLIPSKGKNNAVNSNQPHAVNTSQIDHVIVSTRGVFVIETKSHIGRIAGSEHSQYWEQRLQGYSCSFYNPLLQNASHVKALKKLLPSVPDEAFVSIVVFTEASGLDIRADKLVVERRFLPDKIIRRTLIPSERVEKKWWRRNEEIRLDETKIILFIYDLIDELKRREKILTRIEMTEIAEIIDKVRMDDRQLRKEHTVYAKNTAKNISREIRSGICPRCGGTLLVRKTENGEFLGCENYPRCRFSCRFDG